MKKTFSGIISDDGKLKIFDSAVFTGVLGLNKSRRVLITIETEDPKATVFTQNYFLKVVCSSFIEIFKKQYGEYVNEEIVSERLRKWCPIAIEDGETIPIEEMSQEQLNYLIKHSKMIASEQFDFYIND